MDRSIRTLSREASSSANAEARGRFLAAQARSGLVQPTLLPLLARLGDQAATTSLGPEAPQRVSNVTDAMDAVLSAAGCAAGVLAALSALRACPAWDSLTAPWLALVAALEGWCHRSDLDHANRIRESLPHEQSPSNMHCALSALADAACGAGTGPVLMAVVRMEHSGGLRSKQALDEILSRMPAFLTENHRPADTDQFLLESAAHLRRRVEVGALSSDAVLLAAYAGDLAARAALPGARTFGEQSLVQWLLGLRGLNWIAFLRAIVAYGGLALPAFVRRRRDGGLGALVLQRLSMHLDYPFEYSGRLSLDLIGAQCHRGPARTRAATRLVFHAALLGCMVGLASACRRQSRIRVLGSHRTHVRRIPLGRRRWLVVRHSGDSDASDVYDLPWGKGLSCQSAIALVIERFVEDVGVLCTDESALRAKVGALIAARALGGIEPSP